ncbi:MAG: c-type cytochrome [bacterium]
MSRYFSSSVCLFSKLATPRNVGLFLAVLTVFSSAQAEEKKKEATAEKNPFLERVFVTPDKYVKDPPVSGKMAGDNCSACHGTQGRVFNEGIPPIAGIPKATFVKLMRDFKAGKEKTIVMHWVARAFTDGEIDRMGDYFASMPPTPWLEPKASTKGNNVDQTLRRNPSASSNSLEGAKK